MEEEVLVFRSDSPHLVLEVPLQVPQESDPFELTLRLLEAHTLSPSIEAELFKEVTGAIETSTSKVVADATDELFDEFIRGTVSVEDVTDFWCAKYAEGVFDYSDTGSSHPDEDFAGMYHELVHSPALLAVLRREHSCASAVDKLVKDRNAEIKSISEKNAAEMESAVQTGNPGKDVAQVVSVLAEKHHQSITETMASWDSRLEELNAVQRLDFRDWIIRVSQLGEAGVSELSRHLSTAAISTATEGLTGPVIREESFTIHLGSQMKQNHNLRVMAADVLTLFRLSHEEESSVPDPMRMQTAMTLYSKRICATVLLVDNRISCYSGLKKDFAEICESAPEFHFPVLECQLEAVRAAAKDALSWRRERPESDFSLIQHANANAKMSESLQAGDVFLTVHSNLRQVHLVFHLVMNESDLVSSIPSRHPVLLGLRNILRLCSLFDITTLTVPLLLTHELSEILKHMAVVTCYIYRVRLSELRIRVSLTGKQACFFKTAHEVKEVWETAHEVKEVWETAHEVKEVWETAHEVKEVWEQLRAKYNREKKEARSGSGAGMAPRWKLMDSMRFLDPILESRETSGNVGVESPNSVHDDEAPTTQSTTFNPRLNARRFNRAVLVLRPRAVQQLERRGHRSPSRKSCLNISRNQRLMTTIISGPAFPPGATSTEVMGPNESYECPCPIYTMKRAKFTARHGSSDSRRSVRIPNNIGGSGKSDKGDKMRHASAAYMLLRRNRRKRKSWLSKLKRNRRKRKSWLSKLKRNRRKRKSWLQKLKRNRRKRKSWLSKLNIDRRTKGEFVILSKFLLEEDNENFHNYMRMSPETFKELLEIVAPHLERQATNFRRPISPAERMSITIRFLAHGGSLALLAMNFRIGRSTATVIVRQTLEVLWTSREGSSSDADYEIDGTLVRGTLREQGGGIELPGVPRLRGNASQEAKNIRNYLADCFVSVGSVPWQLKSIGREQ
ncbi:unnamed protein product [Cyprideis torosa]|uniref:Uncharacterized protein n=1 Tax=Cyprideis torosa TaxID=163714 RepID=A0A7R8WHZ7_9CRUS|nr:unnamed protein product [Cyprideis torosa]CAG0894637.1 unnamed protein product [Cyprideis torosa]